MVKKIILGIALFGLVVILVGGAVLHALDKTSRSAEQHSGQNWGRGTQGTGESGDSGEVGVQRRGQGRGYLTDTSEGSTPVDDEPATSALAPREELSIGTYS